MKKIVFVDDEQDIRQSISQLIDWQAFGFELVGEASNGQEALSLIEMTHPDVVLTDIRMPIMDGLALGHAIREFDPTIKIILLSGYDNFQYAQSAIRLNIYAYLLKPVSIQELEEVISSISQAIDAERRNAHDITKLTKEYMNSLTELKRSYLISLVSETFISQDEERLRNIAELYQINLDSEQLRVVNMAISGEQAIVAEGVIIASVKDEVFSEELNWVAYTTMVRDIVQRYVCAYVFRNHNVLTVLISADSAFFENEMDTMLIEIEQSFTRHYGRKVVMGVSQGVTHLHSVQRAYRQAVDALNYCRLAGYSTWMYSSDVVIGEAGSELIDEHEADQLLSYVKLGNSEVLKVIWEKFQQQSVERYRTTEAYSSNVLELVMKALRIYRQNVVHVDQTFVVSVMEGVVASRHDILNDLMMKCRDYLIQITNQIRNNRQEQKETLTAQGIKLIHEHYTNPNFSQKSLANMLHISPNYLSGLFTKETGKSFKEHLIAIRMQNAQRLLLTTDKKILEVAQLSGYTDQHYFSYGFKKYFGKSPRQIREENAQ